MPCCPARDESTEKPDDALGGPVFLQLLHGAAMVELLLVGAALVGPLEHDEFAAVLRESDWVLPLESVPLKSGARAPGGMAKAAEAASARARMGSLRGSMEFTCRKELPAEKSLLLRSGKRKAEHGLRRTQIGDERDKSGIRTGNGRCGVGLRRMRGHGVLCGFKDNYGDSGFARMTSWRMTSGAMEICGGSNCTIMLTRSC